MPQNCAEFHIVDMKKEDFLKTAGYRSVILKQRCHCFDPLDPEGRTARFNPLGHINRGDPAAVIDELQKTASKLYPEPPSGDPFWNNSAQSGFVAIGAYIAAQEQLPLTIGEIYRQIAAQPQEFFQQAAETGVVAGTTLPPACQVALAEFASAPAVTFGGIKKNMTAKLNLWALPSTDSCTTPSSSR